MDLALLEPIGMGAFADIWLAEDKQLARRVAVKFFRDTDPLVQRQVLLDHARALVRVQHPSVVTVFGIETLQHPDTSAETLAIVMEYVPGETLHKFPGRFSSAVASKILRDLSGALEAIHQVGLVHDDLHEGNIIITATGAKVLDILYTRSLAEVGSTEATRDRQNDIRALSILMRKVLEKTDNIRADLLEEAHFRASSAESANAVLEEYRAILEDRVPLTLLRHSARDPRPSAALKNSDLYLVLVQAAHPAEIETHVFAQVAPSEMSRVLIAPTALIATTSRVWAMTALSRTVLLLSDDVLRHPPDIYAEPVRQAIDYSPTTVPDPTLVSAPDNMMIPLATAHPQPMARTPFFMLDRSVHFLGALGPYVFAQQDDYTFSGGAHGGNESAFRLIDLERLVIYTSPLGVMSEEERSLLPRREGAIATATFAAIHSDGMFDDTPPKVDLVAARPEYQSFGEYGLFFKFACDTYYTASGGGWSSYTIAEEVLARSPPVAFQPFMRLPEPLRAALGALDTRSVGFSIATVRNPGRHVIESHSRDGTT